jgi:hypothetical protein
MIWPHNLANCYYADIGCNSAEGAIEFPYDALHVDFVLLRSKIPTSLFDRDRIAENPSAWRAKKYSRADCFCEQSRKRDMRALRIAFEGRDDRADTSCRELTPNVTVLIGSVAIKRPARGTGWVPPRPCEADMAPRRTCTNLPAVRQLV